MLIKFLLLLIVTDVVACATGTSLSTWIAPFYSPTENYKTHKRNIEGFEDTIKFLKYLSG